jgi:hypothetical protein
MLLEGCIDKISILGAFGPAEWEKEILCHLRPSKRCACMNFGRVYSHLYEITCGLRRVDQAELAA